MKNAYLECGKVINTHGFRGAVKLESWCDTPEVLAGLPELYLRDGDAYRPVKVRHASVFRSFVIAELDGVTDEEHAKRLRGTVLYAKRESLPVPEGGYLIADLIGLPVLDADTGERIGTLKDVTQNGHADLYTVETPTGDALIPCVPEFVTRIDPDDAIHVRPIPGLLSGGEEA